MAHKAPLIELLLQMNTGPAGRMPTADHELSPTAQASATALSRSDTAREDAKTAQPEDRK